MFDVKELKNKPLSELHTMLGEKREELRKLRFSAGENQLKDIRSIRAVRGDVARILTAINAMASEHVAKNSK